MARMSLALSIKDLTKIYPGMSGRPAHEAVKGISLDVKEGEFFAILGPNGAGKTTTINCVTGITLPTAGSISVMGHDVIADYRAARAAVGLSPQEFNIDIFQTVDEILDYQAGFFGITGKKMEARRQAMLEQFDLIPHREKKFQFLSGGLKRRAVLAKALMHDPKVLILDEPTAGVDVETRHTLWKFLREMHRGGKTIILTSHYLEEVEALCERVAIIKDGAIVTDDSMKSLTEKQKLEEVYLRVIGNNNKEEAKP